MREDIAAAARKADRDPSEVSLIAVTKTYPASDVRVLAELGVLDVGENRDQEAAPKARATAGLGLRWHFIGQLQTNKAVLSGRIRRFRALRRPGPAGVRALPGGCPV